MGAISVSSAFAAITVTSIYTDLNGSTVSGSSSDGFSSTSFAGSDYQFASSADGAQNGWADGFAAAAQAGETVSGYSYAQAYSDVVGAGSSASWTIAYTKVSFTLDTASNVSYNVWADGAGYGVRRNKASIEFGYNSATGGGTLPSADMGENLTGSILLAAGSYVVELYNKATVTATSNTANSSAASYAYGQSGFSTPFSWSN